jgi:hypothetical protein
MRPRRAEGDRHEQQRRPARLNAGDQRQSAERLGSEDRVREKRRMADAAELPAYLHRLNAEPLFQGRPFAQLQIRTQADSGDAAYSDFALRSTPDPATATTTTTARRPS